MGIWRSSKCVSIRSLNLTAEASLSRFSYGRFWPTPATRLVIDSEAGSDPEQP